MNADGGAITGWAGAKAASIVIHVSVSVCYSKDWLPRAARAGVGRDNAKVRAMKSLSSGKGLPGLSSHKPRGHFSLLVE